MSNDNENLRFLIEFVVFFSESKEALISRESTFYLYEVKVESWRSTENDEVTLDRAGMAT